MGLNSTSASDGALKTIGQSFKKLKMLNVGNTKITDAGIKHLSGLKSLTTLSLNWTLITDQSVDVLMALPGLTDLNLSDTKISEAGAAKFIRKTSLKQLGLPRRLKNFREIQSKFPSDVVY